MGSLEIRLRGSCNRCPRNKWWSSLPGRRTPIGLPWAEHISNRWVIDLRSVRWIQTGRGRPGHHSKRPYQRGGCFPCDYYYSDQHSSHRCCRHHCLVLCLRHLVLAQVKSMVRVTWCWVSSVPRPDSLVGLPIIKVPGGQKIISILIDATV